MGFQMCEVEVPEISLRQIAKHVPTSFKMSGCILCTHS